MPARCFAYFLIVVFAQLNAIDSRAEGTIQPAREYAEMLRSDLIVRGRVQLVTEEFVPAVLFEPQWTHGGSCRIARITFGVSEVMLGSFTEPTCEFVVNMSNSELQSLWNQGDEMVVSLKFDPHFEGGKYLVSANNARFVLNDGSWIRQGHVTADHKFTLNEIRSIVAPVRLETVTTSSDVVAVGVVTSVREDLVEDPENGTARILTVTLAPEELIKGNVATKTLSFQMFNGGTFWPSWAAPWPSNVEPGKRYCVFLNERQGKLYSAGGINGFYFVAKDQLIRNSVVLPTSVKQVRGLVKE